MKEPKTFRHSRLYWVEDYQLGKLRILYVNGKAEYLSGYHRNLWEHYLEWDNLLKPCWLRGQGHKTSLKECVKLMKAYDRKLGQKAVFLGEIK